MARLRSARATSAGGVVVRRRDGRDQLVLGRRTRERAGIVWSLPKGTPQPGESAHATALREVGEETGLQVRILGRLPDVHYVFVRAGTRYFKTVHYFLMEAVGGDFARHDREFEEVRWVDFAETAGFPMFETERALVGQAAEGLGDRAGESSPA